MEKVVMLILIGKRQETAVQVQKLLTAWGCIIKTRLGLHDGVLENCSNKGLLFLELVGSKDQQKEFERKLDLIPGVATKLVELQISEDD